MTDYWFLFGMWIMVFWAIDPLGWKVDFIPVVKQFPFLAITPAFVLVLLGKQLFPKKNSATWSSGNNNILIVIFIFSGFVTAGSVIARFINGIDNSFLTMGLYTLTAPLTAWFIGKSKNPLALVKNIIRVYIFWALVSVAMQMASFGETEVFHAREHLVIGILIFFYLIATSSFAIASAIILIILATIVAAKNSAYLTAIFLLEFILIHSVVAKNNISKDHLYRWMQWAKFLSINLVVLGGLVLIYVFRSDKLPTGNPEYRMRTYEIAWQKFLNSPLWGTAFTGAATEKFDKYSVAVSTQILPTHSDPLDILANGGLIGFLIWISIFVMLLWRWFAILKNPKLQSDSSLTPYLHTMFCVVFTGVIVCMFNPILNTPNLAWSFWALVGALLAVLQTQSQPILAVNS